MRYLANQRFIHILALCAGVFGAAPAFAHDGHHTVMSFAVGFSHPFSGLDHLLVMLAAGIWVAQDRRLASWALPLAFPVIVAIGAGLGMMLGAPMGLELGIAISVAALGLLITLTKKFSPAASMSLIGLFALMHGFAHGIEMPGNASALPYAAGFIAATAALNIAGLTIGACAQTGALRRVMSWGGAGIAAAGTLMLVGAL